jgi:enoyl-CoA hydratase/carnithine racemase
MSIVDWQAQDGTAEINMNAGENRHNMDFVRSILKVLDEIESEHSLGSVLLKSTDNKYWSLGVDVEWIAREYANKNFQTIKDFLYLQNDLFKRLLTYPLPVIACINGHMAANGVILACACDFRFMRSDFGFCRFPEIDLGIPFLPGMIAIARKAMPRHLLEELKYSAKKITARELAEHHVITAALEGESSLNREVLAFAGSFDKPRATLAEMKKRMNRDIIEIIEKHDPEYIDDLKIVTARDWS